MNKELIKVTLSAILGTGAALSALPAAAYQAGDMVVRAGLAGVLPTGDGTTPAGKVEADDGYSLGINFTYMYTDNIGVSVLGAWPFSHDIEGKSGIIDGAKLAEIKHLPPTVTLQYHVDTGSNWNPYVGAGINYTYFFDEDETAVMAGDSLSLDNSWGLALEAGVDMEMQNNVTVGAAVWWIDIDTDAKISGGNLGIDGKYNVEIDPWVFMLSIGKKF